MTQREKIVNHMQEHGSITSLEAMQEYGVMRLASRIAEIKSVYPIEKKVEVSKNRFGEPVRYARYSIKETT